MKETVLHTRREFLRRTVLGGALSWTVPSFLAQTLSALQADADSGLRTVTGKDGTILVVVQMAGGNDGLNTVVPHGNDDYHKARPRIGLAADRVLRLNDELGLHPALRGFKSLFDAGHLAVIQGVGYPNPNRSHFRSTEIWQTASDANRFERHGWLGRYFDNACSGADPAVGVMVGRQMPQAFAAKNPKGINLENPQNYRFITSGKDGDAAEESYRKLNNGDEELMANSGGTIGSLPGATEHGGSVLDFLERTALDAQVSSDQIRSIASRGGSQAEYPGSQLGSSLRLVGKLIGGGLPARVYYVSQGGYDTHTNQLPTQERLLRDLSEAVSAFTSDMKAQGNFSRVLLMTFSEFGRRVAENASGGTDHGAAAPLFVVGEKVKAGIIGRHPSLAPADLLRGDLQFTTDFRSVYASVLDGWLKTSSQLVLGRKFPVLNLV